MPRRAPSIASYRPIGNTSPRMMPNNVSGESPVTIRQADPPITSAPTSRTSGDPDAQTYH
jgi:hypothetical protein